MLIYVPCGRCNKSTDISVSYSWGSTNPGLNARKYEIGQKTTTLLFLKWLIPLLLPLNWNMFSYLSSFFIIPRSDIQITYSLFKSHNFAVQVTRSCQLCIIKSIVQMVGCDYYYISLDVIMCCSDRPEWSAQRWIFEKKNVWKKNCDLENLTAMYSTYAIIKNIKC